MFEKRVSFVGMLFLVFEKAISKEIAAEIFRFVSMLFLVFEKSDEQKICVRNVYIRKYAFFSI